MQAELQEFGLFWAGDPGFSAAMSDDVDELKFSLVDEWAGPLEHPALTNRFPFKTCYLTRGFAEALVVETPVFCEGWVEFFEAAPIRRVVLYNSMDSLAALGATHALERIVSLDIDDRNFDDAALKTVVAGGRLANLRYLNLQLAEGITRAGVEYLAAEQPLPALRELVVNVQGLDISEVVDDSYRQLGDYQNYGPSRDAAEIEARYGYQAWLHPCAQTPLNIAPGPSRY